MNEPIKIEQTLALIDFLDFDMYDGTELQFMKEFDGFDSLDVALLNYKSYTEEELEQIKKLIIERDEKLKNSKGRNVHVDYPDNELFEQMDYTFSKVKVENVITDEKISNE